jgi:hypothetical protein
MTVLLIVDIHIQNLVITSVSVMVLTRGIHGSVYCTMKLPDAGLP